MIGSPDNSIPLNFYKIARMVFVYCPALERIPLQCRAKAQVICKRLSCELIETVRFYHMKLSSEVGCV